MDTIDIIVSALALVFIIASIAYDILQPSLQQHLTDEHAEGHSDQHPWHHHGDGQ